LGTGALLQHDFGDAEGQQVAAARRQQQRRPPGLDFSQCWGQVFGDVNHLIVDISWTFIVFGDVTDMNC